MEADKFPVITLSLNGLDYPDLRKYAKILEDRLLNLDDVGSVIRLGYYDPEFWVEVDPDKAHLYHVSLSEVIRSLRERNVNLTGGNVNSDQGEMKIRTNGEYDTSEDVGQTIVRSNDQGRAVRIDDIARVIPSFEDEDNIYATDGKQSINLMVVKKSSGDIISMVEEIQKTVDEFLTHTPDGIGVAYVDDFSYFVKRRLGVLVNNGFAGAILVMVILFLMLAPPIAASAAIDIPVTFLITLLVMKLIGMTLNLMSMFGLIMVIGMLVDDAIIMAENVFRHIEEGGDPRHAAIQGAQEVMAPVTAAVLTSICAYLPLAFMSGIIGQYVRAIPIVVGIALFISWITTIFAIPTHAAEFTLFLHGKIKSRPKAWFDRIRDRYVKLLKLAIDRRYGVVLGITGFTVFTLMIAATQMKFVLFSSDGMDEFFVRAETPIGTSIQETRDRLLPVEEKLAELPSNEMQNFITEVGISRESSRDPETKYGSHLAQIHVYLTPTVDRNRNAVQIMAEVEKKIKNIEGLTDLRVDKVRPGPPVGKAVEAKIRGDNFDTILKVSEEYKAFLATLPGATAIDDDFELGKNEISVQIDRTKLARTGLTYRDVANEIRYAFEGGIATTIQKSDEEVDIRVKYGEKFTESIDAIEKIMIPNNQGNLIPLIQVANFVETSSIAAIKRFDRKRMVMVTADADESVTTSNQLNDALAQKFKDISARYPGIEVIYAGERERTQESLVSLGVAFGTAMLLIFCIIAIQFRSIIQPPIVMLTIPLGLLGVIWALFLHGKPFSFMSVMGFIGLSGVVVNDSIVMIDFMNKLRMKGMERRESIITTCGSRFRAISMASITTVCGTMPMAYGWGGDDPFIKPMALAFTWGIAFASTITLFAIPCFYAIVDDISVKFLKHSTVKAESEYAASA
jgi:multidrug efflux pump subunit AcrB